MTKLQKHSSLFWFIFLMLVGSCTPALQPEDQAVESSGSSTPTPQPSVMPTLTITPLPPTATLEVTSQVCSPLEGETLDELSEIITQPFKTPRPANDDGHHGVDFAHYRRKDRYGIEGLPVHAALPGTVATILNNKWPYGYTVIIETPLADLTPQLVESLSLPAATTTVVPDPRVNCPPGKLDFELDFSKESIYILYAHLQNPVQFQIDEKVLCGQKIGEVGNSGSSSNPHLHFETRIGPAGARFESMAYYTVQASEQERYNWCVWRVSNLFQLFDPMKLLSIHE